MSEASETVRTLAGLQVQDLEGNRVTLGDLWATRPLVLAFVRHFG